MKRLPPFIVSRRFRNATHQRHLICKCKCAQVLRRLQTLHDQLRDATITKRRIEQKIGDILVTMRDAPPNTQ